MQKGTMAELCKTMGFFFNSRTLVPSPADINWPRVAALGKLLSLIKLPHSHKPSVSK